MQSGKGTEGMPEEGINKHWQAEKVILCSFNLTVKFLAMHISHFPEKGSNPFLQPKFICVLDTLRGVRAIPGMSCLFNVQIYCNHGCGEFKKLFCHIQDQQGPPKPSPE